MLLVWSNISLSSYNVDIYYKKTQLPHLSKEDASQHLLKFKIKC